jgi:ketosteroid isomerase-like protein
MRKLGLILVLAVVCGSAIVLGQATANDEVSKALEQMEKQWNDAARRSDPRPLEQMLAEDFTLTLSIGRVVDKASYVSKIKDGSFKIESLDYSDMKTRVYGDCAVVIGRVNLKGAWDGVDVSSEYAFTDTFVKQAGTWKQVASQVTRIEG